MEVQVILLNLTPDFCLFPDLKAQILEICRQIKNLLILLHNRFWKGSSMAWRKIQVIIVPVNLQEDMWFHFCGIHLHAGRGGGGGGGADARAPQLNQAFQKRCTTFCSLAWWQMPAPPKICSKSIFTRETRPKSPGNPGERDDGCCPKPSLRTFVHAGRGRGGGGGADTRAPQLQGPRGTALDPFCTFLLASSCNAEPQLYEN